MNNVYVEIGTNYNPEWGVEKLTAGHTVYFIEPQPEAFSRMIDYVRANCHRYFHKARFVNVAVYSKSCLVDFETDTQFTTNSAAVTIQEAMNTTNNIHGQRTMPCTYLVHACSLSDLLCHIANTTQKQVSGVLIDTEGSEMPILQGWGFTNKPTELIIEVHHPSNQTKIRYMLSEHYDYVKTEANPQNIYVESKHLYFKLKENTDER